MIGAFSPEESRMIWEFSTTIGASYMVWFLYLGICVWLDRTRKDK